MPLPSRSTGCFGHAPWPHRSLPASNETVPPRLRPLLAASGPRPQQPDSAQATGRLRPNGRGGTKTTPRLRRSSDWSLRRRWRWPTPKPQRCWRDPSPRAPANAPAPRPRAAGPLQFRPANGTSLDAPLQSHSLRRPPASAHARIGGLSPAPKRFSSTPSMTTTNDLSTSRPSRSERLRLQPESQNKPPWQHRRSSCQRNCQASQQRALLLLQKVITPVDRARSVCCRGKTVRPPPLSSRNLSDRRSAICSAESSLTRAAASSSASGIPSSRVTISITAAVLAGVIEKLGRTASARSMNNLTAENSPNAARSVPREEPQAAEPG